MKRRSVVGALAAMTAMPGLAQEFTRPIRVLVGQAPGGGTDLVMRTIAPKLGQALGQQVLIENKLGASGIIAADQTAKAPPDGHTLMMAPSGVMVGNFVMKRSLPYAEKDLAPVALICTFPMLLVVNSAAPVANVAELIRYIKANPAKANASGTGFVFQLQTAAFSHRSGTNVTFVPFRGSNESVQALAQGETLMAFVDVGPVFPAIKSGAVKVLAATSRARLPDFADVPTLQELGYGELTAEHWMALFAPARTPRPMLDRLHTELVKVLALPDVRTALKSRWVEPAGDGPTALTERIRSDIGTWDAVRKAAGLEQLE